MRDGGAEGPSAMEARGQSAVSLTLGIDGISSRSLLEPDLLWHLSKLAT